MKTSKFRPGTIALAVTVLTVPVAVLAAAPKFTMVTGIEAVTIPAQQSETAYNVSQLGGGTRVETVAYNDKSSEAPTFLVYGANTPNDLPRRLADGMVVPHPHSGEPRSALDSRQGASACRDCRESRAIPRSPATRISKTSS